MHIGSQGNGNNKERGGRLIMKFETNLRPQDKRTIAIVVYVAIVALFCWYLIRPAWIKIGDLDDKIKQAEVLKQENRLKTINLSSAEVLYDSAVKDITNSSTGFRSTKHERR